MLPYPTYKRVREILAAHHLSPRKRLGQNYLVDANIARKSLALAEVEPGDCIVEIGPGLGALTQLLLEVGCRLHAVELDSGLYRYLRQQVAPAYPHSLHLLQGDALDQPLAGLPDGEKNFKVVANLPYSISTPWMDAVLSGRLPDRLALMLQKEAADRFVASTGSKIFGPVSLFIQSAYHVEAVHQVSASCFYPVPEVDSALLSLRIREAPLVFDSLAKEGIRWIFRHRRKQIGSIIARMPEDRRFRFWLEGLRKRGFNPATRPEQVKIRDWQQLTATALRAEREEERGKRRPRAPIRN